MGDAVAAAARDDERGNRWLYWLLICFGAVHGLLLALDAHYPSAFLRGDRADSRMAAIEGLRQLSGWHAIVAYLGTHGNIGDYAPQAVLYLAGGRITLGDEPGWPHAVVRHLCIPAGPSMRTVRARKLPGHRALSGFATFSGTSTPALLGRTVCAACRYLNLGDKRGCAP